MMDTEDIVEFFGKLKEVKTEGVEPMVQPFENSDIEREDVVADSGIRHGLMAGAPQKKDDMYVVPRSI